MSSPTQLTTKVLRANGHTYSIVEKYNGHALCKQDLFGFIDILALSEDFGALGIQATTLDHRSERKQKIMSSKKAATWLKAGCPIQLWSWGKKKKSRFWEVQIDAFMFNGGSIQYMPGLIQWPKSFDLGIYGARHSLP